jgi:hypothetical protein
MRRNESDRTRENVNISSSAADVQEIHGMDAAYLFTTNEEELREYLVTKYQNQFPLTDDRKYQFQEDCRLLAHTVRQNLVSRKRISSAPN